MAVSLVQLSNSAPLPVELSGAKHPWCDLVRLLWRARCEEAVILNLV